MKKIILLALCLVLGSTAFTGCSDNSTPFEKKTYTSDTQINEINLDVRDREIEVSLSEDEHVHIQYFEDRKEYYNISVSDKNVLTMASAGDKEWKDYIGGKPSAEKRKISLQIPDVLLENLTLSTTNEDIILPTLAVTGSISLSSNGGNITFGSVDAGNALYLAVKNGDISGTVIGSYDDFAIQCEVKKGESNLPDNKDSGEKRLNVSCNNGNVSIDFHTEQAMEVMPPSVTEPVVKDMNWSDYFEGLNGAAVIYNPSENYYQIYNQKLAFEQRSPCSTFKIISSLIALENGIIEVNDSARLWSGEIFWNEDWNKDITFEEAFRSSCVWYFREVINEIGVDLVQIELDKLRYGNCDISDWEGRLNTNNNNRALTGFWIESSLKISPKEQAEVMERIFGNHSEYSEEAQNQLKQVMLVSEQNETDALIYGKTGMGMAQGVVVDAWFTGFFDINHQRMYFCIYLGETSGADVSSTKAKDIALKIISDY